MSIQFRALPQWVGYRQKQKVRAGTPVFKPNGKPKMDKVPMNPHTGGPAQTNNPATWGSYQEAMDAVQHYGFDGIGFVFTRKTGLVGVDLDDCVNPDGTVNAFAEEVLQQLRSYAEYSPSGDGIHILVGGRIPRALKNGQIEMYDNGRFFTYTGRRVPGYDLPIAWRPEVVEQLYAQQLAARQSPGARAKPAVVEPGPTTIDREQLLGLAMRAANGDRFRALWAGDVTGYASQSEADSALCHMLAFWTGKDAAAVDQLFRCSGLMRDKWDERHYSDGRTYGQQTIMRAIENTIEIYHARHVASDDAGNGSMPDLPPSAQLDEAQGHAASPWLDDYIAFSRQMSPRGYEDFHEAAGLWVLSTVAARRLVLRMGLKAFSPNLYVALCAYTTLFSKSTTARVGLDVLHGAGLDHLLMPNDTTPAAFINQLVARVRPDYADLTPDAQQRERLRLMFAGQRGWFIEEFGTKVQAMMRDNGFMGDFRGILRVFDDNLPNYEYVTISRRDTIEKPYLALLANLTPADIRPFSKPGAALWQDGFWARWAFITPPASHEPSTGRFPSQPVAVPQTLMAPLQQWHQSLGIPKVSVVEVHDAKGDPTGRYELYRDVLQPRSCQLGSGVEDAFYAYHDGLVSLASAQAEQGNADLVGNYGRLAEKAMRIAMLLGSLGNQNQIEMAHWARAQSTAERWRANLHNLAEQVRMGAPSEERQLQEQVVDVIRRHGASTGAEVSRYMRGLSGPEAVALCQRLVQSGVLKIVGETGRNTHRYGLAAA